MSSTAQLKEIALRIREMREIEGYSIEEMAERTSISAELYLAYESGNTDLPFTFIHKCALAFGIEISELLEGHSAHLSSYTVTRKGMGRQTAKEDGISIVNLAPRFRSKIAEPYWVTYEYNKEQEQRPIHLATHSGQEFDLVLRGKLKVQVGEHIEYLEEGDSIYYNSSIPHGMVAVDGRDCLFCAVVLPGEETEEQEIRRSLITAKRSEPYVCQKFIDTAENSDGALQNISFKQSEQFNFAFDIVDEIAKKYPNKRAMLHLDKNKVERDFTFEDMRKESSRAANYFKSLGIQKGDRVMLVLKRHYQFWFAILGLHKLGAVAIPATNQLLEHDFEYRFQAAGVSAIVCTADGNTAEAVDAAVLKCPNVKTKIMVGGSRNGWHDFDAECAMFSSRFARTEDTPCGKDPMLMFFTSGTTGYPKIAMHDYRYPLAHFVTAKYWHGVSSEGLHFTISETGWGKALWGKLYGQWLCEGAVFTYDFDRFDAADILPMFEKYGITTFCAPPTMYRMMIRQDISSYNFKSLQHITSAGEALNPEVYRVFETQTGLRIMEGYGQTETTLSIGNLMGHAPRFGSMGKAMPHFDVHLLDADGNECNTGVSGEICIKVDRDAPCGLFMGYYRDEARTKEVWHDGYYHTGDVAWRDEDGYFWYVGRVDDVIKSSGYRIGPFEIESVITELPYVLECGVSAAEDEVRGQVVKASIVLVAGTEPTEELKKEIQNYVKSRTAPYKYPRIIVFRESLPKTISGKIIRNQL